MGRGERQERREGGRKGEREGIKFQSSLMLVSSSTLHKKGTGIKTFEDFEMVFCISDCIGNTSCYKR